MTYLILFLIANGYAMACWTIGWNAGWKACINKDEDLRGEK